MRSFFTTFLFLVCLERSTAQEANYILLRFEGVSDKTMGPILIMNNNNLIKSDTELIIKTTGFRKYFDWHTDRIHKYDVNTFNLVDTIIFKKGAFKEKANKKKAVLEVYRCISGKIVKKNCVQWGEPSIKYLKRVCWSLESTGGYKDLLRSFERAICYMETAWPCN